MKHKFTIPAFVFCLFFLTLPVFFNGCAAEKTSQATASSQELPASEQNLATPSESVAPTLQLQQDASPAQTDTINTEPAKENAKSSFAKDLFLTLLQLLGSLGILLYGMKLMSDGIQKSAGSGLQKALGLMTGNRFAGFATGFFLTIIIQSSGATTAMEVSFVNAGLMSVAQSVGVTLGANIGTTITAWIVVLFGFNFKISLFAIPIFGAGYILTTIKRLKKQALGEAIMGFGLLFIGLELLKNLFSPGTPDNPNTANEVLGFLSTLGNMGALSVAIGIIAGIIITAIIHSSSAESAIVITMASSGLINWEFAAALVIGSNIGSTIDALMASFHANAAAKRTALVHILFNVATVVLALIVFTPFLALIDMMVPGDPMDSKAITFHIAALHTVLKTVTSIVCLPFTNQIAALVERMIKDDKKDDSVYVLEFSETGGKENASSYLLTAEKAVSDLAVLTTVMFERIQKGFSDRTSAFIEENLEPLKKQEDYADQMKEQITKYLLNCNSLPITDTQKKEISIMIQIVDDLEEMTDQSYNVAMLIQKSITKQMVFTQEDMDRLVPYVDLARQLLYFIKDRINKHLDQDELIIAREIEDQIDVFRKTLKKVARKRLESGADVRSELLYIDLVRQIEKFGDRAFSIANSLSQI